MNKQETNRLVMMQALLSYLKQNRSIWQNSPIVVDAVNALEEITGSIELIRKSTGINQTGLVAEKKSLKGILISRTYQLVSPIFALASKTHDVVLKAKVGFSKSELEAQRDGELASTCKSMVEIARTYLAALAVYGITENELNELEELITSYEISLTSPRVTVSQRKASNEKLKGLFADSIVLLNEQLKRLMIRFETTNPEFYAGYLNANKVVDYGTRYEKLDEPEAVK